MTQRLTRSETDRVIAGVAGGIGQRFGINSTLLRLAWVLSVLFGGIGALVYVILWTMLPQRPPHLPAIRIAEERYARGEITREEFHERRDMLGGRSTGTQGKDLR
jgi:phage shock protein C